MTEALSPQACDSTLRVLYNGSCPICSKEIEHYQRYSEGGKASPSPTTT